HACPGRGCRSRSSAACRRPGAWYGEVAWFTSWLETPARHSAEARQGGGIVAPQRLARAFEARQQLPDLGPEIGTVIHFAQVCQLVRDDVVDDIERKMDEPPVQQDIAVAGARAPAGGGGREA